MLAKANGNTSNSSKSSGNSSNNSSSSKSTSNSNGNGKNGSGSGSDNGQGKDKGNHYGQGKDKGNNGNNGSNGNDGNNGNGESNGNKVGWDNRFEKPKINGKSPQVVDENGIYEVENYINDVSLANPQVLMTSNKNGKYTSSYTYGLNRISVKTLGITDDKYTPLYYHYDGRGSVTSLVNTADQTEAKYRYDAFGVPKPGLKIDTYENGFVNSYGYNGENYDKYTELQYLRARYYEPESGRFLTRDSYLGNVMNPLTLNRYAYANNDPVMNIDPSGHSTLQVGDYGDEVKQLQKNLIYLGYLPKTFEDTGKNADDGDFGERTKEAVWNFQKVHGLDHDGIAGPDTEEALQAAVAASRSIYDKIDESPGSANTGCNNSYLQESDNNDDNQDVGLGFVMNNLPKGTTEIENWSKEIPRPDIQPKPLEIPESDIQPESPGRRIPFLLGFSIGWELSNKQNELSADPWEIAVGESYKVLEKYRALPDSQVTTDDEGKTIIYRSASGTVASMTPRPDKDIEGYKRGLSFQFTKPSGSYYVTRLEEINYTGTLVAIPDGPDHISVRPIPDDSNNTRLKQWAATRPIALNDAEYEGHEFTQQLFKIGAIIK
jgi:RHS repeat-associated protein